MKKETDYVDISVYRYIDISIFCPFRGRDLRDNRENREKIGRMYSTVT